MSREDNRIPIGTRNGVSSKSHRAWDRATYNRNIAIWISSCRLLHSTVCSCDQWKRHFLPPSMLLPHKNAQTQTESSGTTDDRAQANTPGQVSAYNFDSLVKCLTQPQTPIKSILKRPTTEDLLWLSPDVRAGFTPKTYKRKARNLEPDLPPWYTPEMVSSGEDADTEDDGPGDPFTDAVRGGTSPIGHVRFTDEHGTIYDSRSESAL